MSNTGLSDSLIGRLTLLKGRLNKIPRRLGHPFYREVVIRTRKQTALSNGIVTDFYEDLYINPIPKVNNVTWKELGLEFSEQITVGKDDYKIEIVRTVDIPITYNDIEFIVIDPIFNNDNKLIGGLKCKVIHISENAVLDWTLILRLYKDNYTIDPQNSVVIANPPQLLTPTSPTPTSPTVVNQGAARYLGTVNTNNIISRTQLNIDGNLSGSYDDTGYVSWDGSKIKGRELKQLIEVQLQFSITTDTLGGQFNIEFNQGGIDPILVSQDLTINAISQDYTINANLVVDNDFLTDGARIFLTPELGMKIDISNLELLLFTNKT